MELAISKPTNAKSVAVHYTVQHDSEVPDVPLVENALNVHADFHRGLVWICYQRGEESKTGMVEIQARWHIRSSLVNGALNSLHVLTVPVDIAIFPVVFPVVIVLLWTDVIPIIPAPSTWPRPPWLVRPG